MTTEKLAEISNIIAEMKKQADNISSQLQIGSVQATEDRNELSDEIRNLLEVVKIRSASIQGTQPFFQMPSTGIHTIPNSIANSSFYIPVRHQFAIQFRENELENTVIDTQPQLITTCVVSNHHQYNPHEPKPPPAPPHVFHTPEPLQLPTTHQFCTSTNSAPHVFDRSSKTKSVAKFIAPSFSVTNVSPHDNFIDTVFQSFDKIIEENSYVLELPIFDGNVPREWIIKARNHFKFNSKVDVDMIRLSGLRFEGRASTWYRWFYETKNEQVEWKKFLHDLLVRFDDYEVDMCYLVNPLNIQQRSSVNEYEIEFLETKEIAEYVYNFVFKEEILAYNFINGLKDEIRETIDLWSLKTLQGAVNWAKFQELQIEERLLFEANEEEYEMYEGMKCLFNEKCPPGGCVEYVEEETLMFEGLHQLFDEIPALGIKALQNRAGPETTRLFDDTTWENLSVIVNALDTINARLYVDRKCLYFQKPRLQYGTLRAKCNTQMILPHLIVNYNASKHPLYRYAPMCIVHSFPYNIDRLLEQTLAGLFNTSEYFSAIVNAGDAQTKDKLECVFKCLNKDKCEAFQDFNTWARLKFEDCFNNRVKALIFTFPEVASTSTETPFCSAPKQFPQPLQFTTSNPNYLHSVMAASIICAETFGISIHASNARDVLNHTTSLLGRIGVHVVLAAIFATTCHGIDFFYVAKFISIFDPGGGACDTIQAAISRGDENNKMEDFLLLDVTPLSLVLETVGRFITFSILRKTTILTKKEQVISAYLDNRIGVLFHVLQGKSLRKNFKLPGALLAPRGMLHITAFCDIDANGILLNNTVRCDIDVNGEEMTPHTLGSCAATFWRCMNIGEADDPGALPASCLFIISTTLESVNELPEYNSTYVCNQIILSGVYEEWQMANLTPRKDRNWITLAFDPGGIACTRCFLRLYP